MMQVEQLQREIEALPPKEFMRLWQWLAEKEWDRWDQQLAVDVAAGRLDFLLEEALSAKTQGKLRDL
jgi:hypothetical protein